MTIASLAARAAALVVFGLGCMAIGARCASSSGSGQAAAPPRPAAPAITRLSNEDRAELRRELAEDVRRVLAAQPATGALVAAAPASAEPASVEPAAPPSASAVAARETAHRVVADAVARGSWRPEDGQALRATMAELDQAAVSQLLGELARAVNTGQLQIVARDRPMF